MLRRPEDRIFDMLMVIGNILRELREPDDLLCPDRLAVDDSRDLHVRPAGIKADSASAEVSADRQRSCLVFGHIRKIALLDLKRPLIGRAPEIDVECAQTVLRVGVADVLINRMVARQHHLPAARTPEDRLDEAFCIAAVLCEIVAELRVASVDQTVLPLHGDRKRLCCFAEKIAVKIHRRDKITVENRLNHR